MSLEYDDIETALVSTGSVSAAAKALGVPRGTIRAKLAEWKASEILDKWSDTELVEQNVRAKKQAQRYADLNRVERKGFREFARVENSVSAYAERIKQLLENNWTKRERQDFYRNAAAQPGAYRAAERDYSLERSASERARESAA